MMTRPDTCSPRPPVGITTRLAAALLAGLLGTSAAAGDTSAIAQQQYWTDAAGSPASAERGRQFFSTRFGGEWSCASCHGDPPVAPSRHALTGKSIAPLAPSANTSRFTDSAKVEKWFRRNCRDVLDRECTAREKSDLLAFLTGLKP